MIPHVFRHVLVIVPVDVKDVLVVVLLAVVVDAKVVQAAAA